MTRKTDSLPSLRIAYYRDWSGGAPVWCYAMTIDGEHDHSDPVDGVDGTANAATVEAALAAIWPHAQLRRVDDIGEAGGAR